MSITTQQSVTIREASHDDRGSLVRLAQRDSASVPTGTVLVAEVGGSIAAAIGLERGDVIADPFRRTADAVSLLRTRVAQLHGARRKPLRVVARTAVVPRALRGRATA